MDPVQVSNQSKAVRGEVQVDATEVVLLRLDLVESHGSPPEVCFVDPKHYKVGFGRRP